MVFTSSFPDTEIVTGSLVKYVLQNVEKFGDRAAYIAGDGGAKETTLRFSDLRQVIARVGAGLTANGFVRGDTLMIYSPNSIWYPIAYLACLAIGGTATTCNPVYTPRELGHQLKDSKAKFAICTPAGLDALKAGIKQQEKTGQGVSKIWVWDGVINRSDVFCKTLTAVRPFSELLKADPAAFVEVDDYTGEEVASLPYSSGTTGLSKGVKLTHNNIIANLCQCCAKDVVGFTETDTVIAMLPFYHIYGQVVIMLMTLITGSTCVVLSKFTPPAFLSLIQKHKVTIAPIVPPVVLFMAKHPLVSKFDLSSLRYILCGAAPLGAELAEACVARFPKVDLRQGYGMTELSPVCHVSPINNKVFHSAGILVPNTKAKIIDTSGEEVAVGERGELCIQGPQVMAGYLNNEEATAHTIDSEKWLHTGDIAYADDQGYFFVVDRLKELIKYKGLQVAPAELEDLILSCPGVADVAVVPVPDEKAGELPKAFVVKKPDAVVSAQDIIDYVADKVAVYKQLRGGVDFVDAIQKSGSGKILRRIYKEQERQKYAATHPATE